MSFDAGGRFAFLLGSKTPIPAAAFAHRPTVYFEFKVDGERFGDGHGRLRRARCRGGDVRDPRRLLRKEPPHLSSDTVDSRHILDASIGTSDIADRSIRGVDIALSAVDSVTSKPTRWVPSRYGLLVPAGLAPVRGTRRGGDVPGPVLPILNAVGYGTPVPSVTAFQRFSAGWLRSSGPMAT